MHKKVHLIGHKGSHRLKKRFKRHINFGPSLLPDVNFNHDNGKISVSFKKPINEKCTLSLSNFDTLARVLSK